MKQVHVSSAEHRLSWIACCIMCCGDGSEDETCVLCMIKRRRFDMFDVFASERVGR